MKIVFVIIILEIIYTGVNYYTKWCLKQIVTLPLSKSLLVKLECECHNTWRTMLQEGKDGFGSFVLCVVLKMQNIHHKKKGGGGNHVGVFRTK
jgi:hypothetical protein